MEAGGSIHRLDVLLPLGFPWELPRIALVDPPPFLLWPHIEIDGLLCLAPNTIAIDPNDPGGVIACMLQAAVDLLGYLLAGNFESDFRTEFLTYWSFAADDNGASIVSLINPKPPTRMIFLWRGKGAYVLGESVDQLKSWLANRTGSTDEKHTFQPAAFIWAGTPLIPTEYPSTAQDIRKLANKIGVGATALLTRIIHDGPDKSVILLGFETQSGPALAATICTSPARDAHGAREPLTKGFRPGTVPEGIMLARYFGGGKLLRRPAQRADAAWIHGRGHDPRTEKLQKSSVTVIGCGSVGAPSATTLAQAGVGNLNLVDFDTVKWENVGRQPFGAQSIGQNKAKALAERLRTDYPHIRVDHYEIDLDTMVRKHSSVLERSNLILSATGSWSADGRLEAWRSAFGSGVPVLYSWTEAHACAGHAVLLGPSGGCLRCGFDNTGLPKFQVTSWPSGSVRSEPACGGVYQPYGPVELGFINCLTTELALDALLGEAGINCHRVWIGAAGRLKRLGGVWAESWSRQPEFQNEGGFVLSKSWPNGVCERCIKVLAA